jgi:signal transduction histidine kinase
MSNDEGHDDVEEAMDRVRVLLDEVAQEYPEEQSAKIERGHDMADQLEGTLKEVRRN